MQAAKELALRCATAGLAAGLRIEQFVNRMLQRTDDAAEGAQAFAREAPAALHGKLSMSNLSGRYVIAGIGHTAFGKLPGRDTISMNVEACRNALADAGIDKSAGRRACS